MSSFDLKIDITVFDWILADVQKKIEGRIIKAIREWLNILLAELKKNTPEDTKEMLKSYKVVDVQKKWDTYIWVIGNTAKHSIYVEYWRDKVFNYHKPKWSVFYRWVWNKTFQRSLLSVQDKIYKLVTDAIW
jgi:hypothetical protein